MWKIIILLIILLLVYLYVTRENFVNYNKNIDIYDKKIPEKDKLQSNKYWLNDH